MGGKVEGNGRETTSTNLEDLLQGFGADPALRVAVERMYPNAGYLRLYPVPPQGPDLLFQQVRQKHGPGTYRFRPYGTRPNGRPGYLPGSVTLELADMSDDEPRGNVPAVAGGAVAPVVVQQGGGLAPELLRALLDRKDPSDSLLNLFGRLILDRNQQPTGGGNVDPLDQFERYLGLFDRLRRRGEPQPQQQQQQQQEPDLESVMLRAILDKVFSPGQPQHPQHPPQHPHAHPHAHPQHAHPPQQRTARRTRPAPAPPPTPAPPGPRVDMHTSMAGGVNGDADVEDDEVEDDEVEDDTLSLEDDLAEHLGELAANPDQAVAWLVQNVFRKLDPRVLARLGELQRQVEQQQQQQQQQPAPVVPLHGFGGRS
jgi:hypothetical protein